MKKRGSRDNRSEVKRKALKGNWGEIKKISVKEKKPMYEGVMFPTIMYA